MCASSFLSYSEYALILLFINYHQIPRKMFTTYVKPIAIKWITGANPSTKNFEIDNLKKRKGSSRHNNQLCDNPTPSNILLYVTSVYGCLYSMDYYLQKTYYKTAALISNSCKAVAVLAGQTTEVQALAYHLSVWQTLGVMYFSLPRSCSYFASHELL
jgi:hypothetical protein